MKNLIRHITDGMSLREKGGLLLCLLWAAVISGCEKGEEVSDSTIYEVTIVFPPNSLGDNGFYDKLLLGVTRFENSHPARNTQIMVNTPYDSVLEREMYVAWFNSLSAGDSVRKLLIVPNYDALSGLDEYVTNLPEYNDVLFFSEKTESTEMKGWHRTFLDEYSVAFLLGQKIAEDKYIEPVKMKVSGQDYLYHSVEKGISDGYSSIRGVGIDSFVIADSDSVIKTMTHIYDFVDDICEESQFGTCIIPLLGEYQNIFYYYDLDKVIFLGIDMNIQSHINCLFSIVRNYDLLLYDRLNEWLLKHEFSPYERYCNDGRYIEWYQSSLFYDKDD